MKLDPGIHIVMHSVLSLKPGVTSKLLTQLDTNEHPRFSLHMKYLQ